MKTYISLIFLMVYDVFCGLAGRGVFVAIFWACVFVGFWSSGSSAEIVATGLFLTGWAFFGRADWRAFWCWLQEIIISLIVSTGYDEAQI